MAGWIVREADSPQVGTRGGSSEARLLGSFAGGAGPLRSDDGYLDGDADRDAHGHALVPRSPARYLKTFKPQRRRNDDPRRSRGVAASRPRIVFNSGHRRVCLQLGASTRSCSTRGIDAFGLHPGVAYRGNNLNTYVGVTDPFATTVVWNGAQKDLAPGCCKVDGGCFRKDPHGNCVAGDYGASSGPNAFVPTNFTQADAACEMPRRNRSLDGFAPNAVAGTSAPESRPVCGRGQCVNAASPRTRLVRGRGQSADCLESRGVRILVPRRQSERPGLGPLQDRAVAHRRRHASAAELQALGLRLRQGVYLDGYSVRGVSDGGANGDAHGDADDGDAHRDAHDGHPDGDTDGCAHGLRPRRILSRWVHAQ